MEPPLPYIYFDSLVVISTRTSGTGTARLLAHIKVVCVLVVLVLDYKVLLVCVFIVSGASLYCSAVSGGRGGGCCCSVENRQTDKQIDR